MEKPNTLITLLDQYVVEIPIMQRDYVQGRGGENSKEWKVRNKLLSDVKKTMDEGGTLDFNFIYGKIEGEEKFKRFIPLDGQQRLTTLFLVHLYAFADDQDKTELLQKFSYETRQTSREFLKQLVKNREKLFSDLNSKATGGLSALIEDAAWYRVEWDNDPTVASVKKMLDLIVEKFGREEKDRKKVEQAFTRENPPVQFKFLSIDQFGLDDGIYIKMNARGRELTPFENFKAQLVGRVKLLHHEEEFAFEPSEFDKKMDVEWTDLFWEVAREECEKSKDSVRSFNEMFETFFHVIFAQYASLDAEKVIGVNGVEANTATSEMLEAAYYTMEYICKYKDGCDGMLKILRAKQDKRIAALDQLRWFALAVFLQQSKPNPAALADPNWKDGLDKWLRVTRNLLNNTRDHADKHVALLKAMKSLCQHRSNLYSVLAAGKDNLTAFASEQIEEERIKAALILRDAKYETMIGDAEKHPYFKGQLRAALQMAEIDLVVANTASVNDLPTKMVEFQKYWNQLSNMFGDKAPKDGLSLRRALLTIGNYTMPTVRGGMNTLCIDSPDEPTSLKALFADNDKEKKKWTKLLLDELLNRQTFEDMITNSKVAENDWRYCFIQFPQMFEAMDPQYYRIRLSEPHLVIKKKAGNGIKIEMFSYALGLKLGLYKSYQRAISIYSRHYSEEIDPEDTGLYYKNYFIQYKNGAFKVLDKVNNTLQFKTTGDKVFTDVCGWLSTH